MNRVYIDKIAINDGYVQLSQDDSVHVARVLRLVEGDHLLVCDGENGEYDSIITSVGKKRVVVKLHARHEMDVEPNIYITLYQAMPKGCKLEYVIQKCTEVGVCAFVPFYAARSIATGSCKFDRYVRVAREAAKQCGRGILPSVDKAIEFEEMIIRLQEHEFVIAPWEEAKELSIKTVLREAGTHEDIAIVIGPEGGMEEGEVKKIEEVGAHIVTLGKRILRTETAGLVTAAAVLYEMGELE